MTQIPPRWIPEERGLFFHPENPPFGVVSEAAAGMLCARKVLRKSTLSANPSEAAVLEP
jgi:hypothetical protein